MPPKETPQTPKDNVIDITHLLPAQGSPDAAPAEPAGLSHDQLEAMAGEGLFKKVAKGLGNAILDIGSLPDPDRARQPISVERQNEIQRRALQKSRRQLGPAKKRD